MNVFATDRLKKMEFVSDGLVGNVRPQQGFSRRAGKEREILQS